jgi:hypothetical protein
VILEARNGGNEPVTEPVDHLPDYIHHTPGGSLYVSGQNAHPQQLAVDCPSGSCPQTTTIFEVDPATMNPRMVVRLPPKATFSDGPSALQVGDTIFLQGGRGNAFAYMKAPKQ